jgi:hypothetical protein
MPRLGEVVEPAHEHTLAPWWREVDRGEVSLRAGRTQDLTMPKAAPWPLD